MCTVMRAACTRRNALRFMHLLLITISVGCCVTCTHRMSCALAVSRLEQLNSQLRSLRLQRVAPHAARINRSAWQTSASSTKQRARQTQTAPAVDIQCTRASPLCTVVSERWRRWRSRSASSACSTRSPCSSSSSSSRTKTSVRPPPVFSMYLSPLAQSLTHH